MKLNCNNCKRYYQLDSGFYRCPNCHEQLEILNNNLKFEYDKSQLGIWKYSKELPIFKKKILLV